MTYPSNYDYDTAPFIAAGNQDVSCEQYVTVNARKVRLDVRSNAYKSQSHARAFVWDQQALRWNALCEIPPALMNTPEGLCYRPGAPSAAPFERDLTLLLRRARAIFD